MKNDKGFTLIEVVIALGVLGFGILSMFSMQAFAIRGNADANKITREVTWGVDGLEEILSLDYTDIVYKTWNVDGNLYTITRNVQTDVPLPGLATIDITMSSNVGPKQVTLQYVKANPGDF